MATDVVSTSLVAADLLRRLMMRMRTLNKRTVAGMVKIQMSDVIAGNSSSSPFNKMFLTSSSMSSLDLPANNRGTLAPCITEESQGAAWAVVLAAAVGGVTLPGGVTTPTPVAGPAPFSEGTVFETGEKMGIRC